MAKLTPMSSITKTSILLLQYEDCYSQRYAIRKFIQCVSIKSLHFSKVPHINISKYIQEISIHVGSYIMDLFYQMIPTKLMDIVCLSEQEPHLWNWPKSRLDRKWYLFCLLSAKLRVVKRLQNYHSDGLMTLYEKICFVVCIFWHMPSTFYASSSY